MCSVKLELRKYGVEVFRIVTLCNVAVGDPGTLVSYHSIARRHKTEDHDLKHRCHESLKTRTKKIMRF
jgi:hypothetical protein